MFSKIKEVEMLSEYLRGAASIAHNADNADTLQQASKWLKKLSQNMCEQGFIGCNGGEKCGSSHK